jgi:hypothetical protein
MGRSSLEGLCFFITVVSAGLKAEHRPQVVGFYNQQFLTMASLNLSSGLLTPLAGKS